MPTEEAAMTDPTAPADIVLDVRHLSTHFRLHDGVFKAVDDVSFVLRAGRTLCVVGESGSGKSVTARSILRIVDPPGEIVGGEMLLRQGSGTVDLAKLEPRGKAIRAIRGRDISMIFQEPMSSLSPIHTIGAQIDEALQLHSDLDRSARRRRIVELLARVEIPEPAAAVDRYAFEFSGGMRQRAMIAMALACTPKILIADEPTTALDVTTQAEILDLIKGLQRDTGMAVMFITHDMGVVAEIADDVMVMYRGRAVETAPVHELFAKPRHAYSEMLIRTATKLEHRAAEKQAPAAEARPILTVEGLSKRYRVGAGLFGRKSRNIDAVAGVSFTLAAGETLGIVGESGSGKSTLGRCLVRLIEPTAGRVVYHRPDGDLDLTRLDDRALRPVYREMRMIFQDPFSSLNPRMTVGQIVGEPLRLLGLGGRAAEGRVAAALERVELPADAASRYPHAFSGGQRQRIGIARALVVDPRLIIADEATAALDVSLRAQMLDLLLELQRRLDLSFVFISHDIGVIRYFCDRVAVMYRGRFVEIGATADVCDRPRHAYTQALLSAVPRADPTRRGLAGRHRFRPDMDAGVARDT
jgi:peptide/nickel transport system ATP-binding protein